jgi:16S rRNA (guanine527-N7)-methyltransferase
VTGDGPSAVLSVADVSRETIARLEAYVELIRRWNGAENLVSPTDLTSIWTRHIADCAQLPALAPAARRWVDIGSGAGLPGLVVAVTATAGTAVALVESNQRKCAFLRQAIRAADAPATVHHGRAEAVLAEWQEPVDVLTARAVAPLDRLFGLAAPILTKGAVGLFPKGRGYQAEVDEAALNYAFDLVQHTSRIDPDGVILEVRDLRRTRPR